MFTFPSIIMMIFTSSYGVVDDPQLLAMTKRAFMIYSLSFLFCGFNIFGSSFFTALNNGLVSAAISFLRARCARRPPCSCCPLSLSWTASGAPSVSPSWRRW